MFQAHFEAESWERTTGKNFKKLKKSAIPTLFMISKNETSCRTQQENNMMDLCEDGYDECMDWANCNLNEVFFFKSVF